MHCHLSISLRDEGCCVTVMAGDFNASMQAVISINQCYGCIKGTTLENLKSVQNYDRFKPIVQIFTKMAPG